MYVYKLFLSFVISYHPGANQVHKARTLRYTNFSYTYLPLETRETRVHKIP